MSSELDVGCEIGIQHLAFKFGPSVIKLLQRLLMKLLINAPYKAHCNAPYKAL